MRARFLVGATLIAQAFATSYATGQAPERLTGDSGGFRFGGKPIQIISGEMHYARVPREYWRDRLRKARAMGLNTVSTYVFWNLHELTPGRYDFSGQKDVAEFIRIAQAEGLHVIVRPGPYVCAEWDLGGYPAWLLADSAMILRSSDERFTGPASRWLDRLGHELAPLFVGRGGPIMAVQVENEYGSFDHDTAYLAWQRSALLHAGFGGVLLYTADGDVQLPNGTLPGLPAVVNFGAGEADSSFARLIRFRPAGPRMSGEYWAGWFDQWGRPHARTNAPQQARELSWMLERGYSVNLYMFHGGTTFGFMNGANIDRGRYLPQTTSYDYDAALDESGRPTPKYDAFREVIAKHDREAPPPVPATDSAIAIAAFRLDRFAPLWPTLRSGIRVDEPRNMESFGQAYGYIDYRTIVRGPAREILVIHDVRDYAQVYVNGVLQGSLDRRLGQDSLPVDVPSGQSRLDILVENTGRVNFNKPLREERKGITRSVSLGGRAVRGWEVFPLPMSTVPRPRFGNGTGSGPGFFRGTFALRRTGDTFLDTRGWGKGSAWVNGHHLGRFWSIGPQQTLYVPGPWLRRGLNEIVVFDLETPERSEMAGLTSPILDRVRVVRP